MIIRRVCTALAALALPAALLVTATPAAHAIAGRCPDWTHSVGAGPKSISNGSHWLGNVDVRYSYQQTIWCVEVNTGWSDSKVNVKYNASSTWGPDTVGDGPIHVWLNSNGGKCVDAFGSIQGSAVTIQRCRV
ncbi:hypothetical protein GCM10009745_47720 [Kribbella yunnanensis]|uniref:Secreted protein n=1 Tax=Kribbella yunnanensis TaxID=190194 RepID=A0ABP4U269_9ACTN